MLNIFPITAKSREFIQHTETHKVLLFYSTHVYIGKKLFFLNEAKYIQNLRIMFLTRDTKIFQNMLPLISQS